jgi:hypothetical protein
MNNPDPQIECEVENCPHHTQEPPQKERHLKPIIADPQSEVIEEILQKLAIESWGKGKNGLFLSIGDNFGAALEPAKQALLKLVSEARISELKWVFDNAPYDDMRLWEVRVRNRLSELSRELKL